MATILKIVEDNTAPDLSLTLERDGTVINLTGCSVSLIIQDQATSTVTNTGHQTCAITTPTTAGIVTYSPQAGDFPDAGSYVADVEITYANGSVERLYDQIKIKARKKIV